MPPLRDTLSRRSKTSCNRSYSPLLCRSRKSVSLSWRDGPLSANSIFTPTPPMQKQYGFLTVCKNREMRSFRESALSKVIPLTSGRDSAATAPMSTLLICSSSCVVNFTVSNQQKYILEILKEFKYLRVRQLHALVQAHYRTQGIKIDERRMEIMLRQMRTGTNYVWLRGDVVSYGDRRIDPRLLEALDVMLELTRVQPGFYSKDGLHEPFLLRFTGNGKGAGYLFSVAWLDAATHIATVPRMKGERIIWISESGSFGEIDLPRHHFFAARQKDGTHRFFGSNEPEKI